VRSEDEYWKLLALYRVLHVSFPCYFQSAKLLCYALILLLFLPVQTHDCNRSGGRCLKVDPKTGKKFCRNYMQESSASYAFKPAEHSFKKEDAELLQDAGMATVNGDDFEIHQDMIGGRFIYPATRSEKRLPTNPLLFLVMRSCTNVQVCFVLNFPPPPCKAK
jgi:hypothetical protein